MNKYLDVFFGKMVLIADSSISNRMLNYRELCDKKIKNDWIIAFKMDYRHKIVIINRKYPKHKQLAKLINLSVEHGTNVKRDRLTNHGFLLLYYLFERIVEPVIVNQVKQVIQRKPDHITFDHFFGILMLLVFMLSISLIVFIAENAYFRLFNYLNTKNG